VHDGSLPDAKVAFFAALFAARTEVCAVRFDNPRTGKHGSLPAVRGGWRKGVWHEDRDNLPLTASVLAAYLRRGAHRPIPVAGPSPLLVAGGRFRRAGRAA